MANRQAEVAALEARYHQALAEARQRGAEASVTQFDAAMKTTVPVINMSIAALQNLITQDQALYWNYHKGVRSSTRKAASLIHDRERMGVDGTLFGQVGEQLIAAALSLECRGLISYGAFRVQLREVAISKRSSLLEENSYFFVDHHQVVAGKPIPFGFLSSWGNRHKLAVAKLASRLDRQTSNQEYQLVLLRSSSGDRDLDDFIEIQIYGSFDNNAVEKISGAKPTSPLDIAMWDVIKEMALARGKAIEELS